MAHERKVVLFYFNKKEADIAFRRELDELMSLTSLKLKEVLILSKQENWEGEKGRFNAKLLEKHCQGYLLSYDFYVCGPPPMSEAVIKNLKELQIPLKKTHTEMFGLAGPGGPFHLL